MARLASGVLGVAQYDDNKGLTAVKAVNGANERRLVILSNKLLDGRLVGSKVWEGEKEFYPAWSGDCVGYEKPKTAFREKIVVNDLRTGVNYVFPVPSGFRGAVGSLLLVQQGFDGNGKPIVSFEKDGKDFVVAVPNEKNVLLVEGFPAKDGFCKTEEHVIPVGERVSNALPNARYLSRKHGAYVGLAARGYYGFYYVDGDNRRDIRLDGRPFGRLGVLAVEGPLVEGIRK